MRWDRVAFGDLSSDMFDISKANRKGFRYLDVS